MSQFLLEKYKSFMNLWMDIFIKRINSNNVYEALNTTVSFSYQLITYVLLGFKVFSKTITVGSFTMGINSLNSFMSATNGIVQSIIDVRSKIVFISKYDNFLKIPNQNSKYAQYGLEKIDLRNMEIEFDNVSFKYPGSTTYIFRNLSLKIKGDEKIAIVGENGAGKTTFVMLLTRMYVPTEGRILINGVDIRKFETDSFMRLFSVVHQDFLILPFSIYENIVFQPKEEEEKYKAVMDILAQCGMEERIANMYQGLMTPISKELDARGVDLSGGGNAKACDCQSVIQGCSRCDFG